MMMQRRELKTEVLPLFWAATHFQTPRPTNIVKGGSTVHTLFPDVNFSWPTFGSPPVGWKPLSWVFWLPPWSHLEWVREPPLCQVEEGGGRSLNASNVMRSTKWSKETTSRSLALSLSHKTGYKTMQMPPLEEGGERKDMKEILLTQRSA